MPAWSGLQKVSAAISPRRSRAIWSARSKRARRARSRFERVATPKSRRLHRGVPGRTRRAQAGQRARVRRWTRIEPRGFPSQRRSRRGPDRAAGRASASASCGAVEATRSAVGQNTNLGIMLLCAPLARAAELRAARMREAVAGVLAELDVEDADLAFRAIALANPGGLGRATRHDVSQRASVTLLEAMAKRRRGIGSRGNTPRASQTFSTSARRALEAASRRWPDCPAAATLAVYFGFLAAFPDTHILRKSASTRPSTCNAKRRRCTRSRRTPTIPPNCGNGRCCSMRA